MNPKIAKRHSENIYKIDDSFQVKSVGARPFLKWAGGKGLLLKKFQELYPKELKQNKIKTFYEPFLGSGAVFFDVAQNYKIERAYLYDINEELILAYKVIQKDVGKLLEFLHQYQKQYLRLDNEHRKELFYAHRADYNQQRYNIDFSKYSENWPSRAAQIIFLNKTCYNGLFRVNSKGAFNSPAGDYKNVTICDEQNLMAVNRVLQIAEIKKADFKEIISDLKVNSFVYFDPPYRPISKTASFKAYSKHNFEDNEQIQLANLFAEFDKKGVKIMLSNSDPKNIDPDDDFFDELYKNYIIRRIPVIRKINSNPTKRGAINEIIVTNYRAV